MLNVDVFFQQILDANKISKKQSGCYTSLLNFLITKLCDKCLVH